MWSFSMTEVLFPDLQFSNQRSYSSQLKPRQFSSWKVGETIKSSPFINLVFVKTLIAVVSEGPPDPVHWLGGRKSPETGWEVLQAVASPQGPVSGVIMVVDIGQRHVGGVHPGLRTILIISEMTGPKIHAARVKLGLISYVPIHVCMRGKSSSAEVGIRYSFWRKKNNSLYTVHTNSTFLHPSVVRELLDPPRLEVWLSELGVPEPVPHHPATVAAIPDTPDTLSPLALVSENSPAHVHLDLRPGDPGRHDTGLLEPGHLGHQVIKLVLDPLEGPALHNIPRLHQEVHQPLLLRYNDALIINSQNSELIKIISLSPVCSLIAFQFWWEFLFPISSQLAEISSGPSQSVKIKSSTKIFP